VTKRWAADFGHRYNIDHRRNDTRYVSPAQRHAVDDKAILAARDAPYTQARERNPARWSGTTRNWLPIDAVMLNGIYQYFKTAEVGNLVSFSAE